MPRIATTMLLTGVLLGGCGTVPTHLTEDTTAVKAYDARVEKLGSLTHWALDGRLAISDGKEGGSGHLSWTEAGPETQMLFRGALGKGAWQLQSDESGARLELANGTVSHAPTIGQVVVEQVGWKVPVDALSWWIKGLAQPGKWEARTLDQTGRLTKLRQFGWDVKFDNYAGPDDAWVPKKLTARRGHYLVKMVVREWKLGPGGLVID